MVQMPVLMNFPEGRALEALEAKKDECVLSNPIDRIQIHFSVMRNATHGPFDPSAVYGLHPPAYRVVEAQPCLILVLRNPFSTFKNSPNTIPIGETVI